MPIHQLLQALEAPLLATLNHLIRDHAWASARLQPHAGAQVKFLSAGLDFYLKIDAQGLFAPGNRAESALVSIELPANFPMRFLADRQSVFQTVKLSGAADFAEALAFVFRHLEWDVEADMARIVGDIPAHRLELLRRRLFGQTRESSRRFFGNLAEYLTEDSAFLVSEREVLAFGVAIDSLRDDVARLEKRLNKLN